MRHEHIRCYSVATCEKRSFYDIERCTTPRCDPLGQDANLALARRRALVIPNRTRRVTAACASRVEVFKVPELLSAVDVREIPDLGERRVVVRAAEIGDRAGLGLDSAL